MGFWDFIVMLGSPAKPSRLESCLEKIVKAFDTPAHEYYFDKLREAERKMKNV